MGIDVEFLEELPGHFFAIFAVKGFSAGQNTLIAECVENSR
jgi:hypothetical protein